MNSALNKINLLGVLVLAGLCAYQWKINRDLNLSLMAVDKERLEKIVSLADEQKKTKEQGADLDYFRAQLTASKGVEKELKGKLDQIETAHTQVMAERDSLKTNVTEWAGAVKLRDERLAQSAEAIQKLITERDEVVQKYNDLAKRQNDLVAEINKAREMAATNAAKPKP